MDYSVVIPAYNEAHYLPATLTHLNAAMAAVTSSFRGEVIVVDNNSSDATASIAIDYGAALVFEPLNQISKARNAGAKRACGRYLVFLDADTTVDSVVLLAALKSLERGGTCGGGASLAMDRSDVLARVAVRTWNRFARAARLAAGCFLFCRRDAFEAVGGFSVKVYASEEIWLSKDLRQWGRRRNRSFTILEETVSTSARKLDWMSRTAIARQILIFVFFPWAVRSKRWCGAWYQRPPGSERRSPSVILSEAKEPSEHSND